MQLNDFIYHLPPQLIAQRPAEQRDHSRLLVLSRGDGAITHRNFYHLMEYLQPGDLLVLNNTKVLPAKLTGRRATGGLVELLLVREITAGTWECLLNSRGRIKPSETIRFTAGITGTLTRDAGQWFIRFTSGDIPSFLSRIGRAPLPPYIKRTKAVDPEDAFDRERYQTVYAEQAGAIAAPTAGLHFTPELLERIRAKGVFIVYLTLHIGRGTFEPVRVTAIEDHRMPAESFEVPSETLRALQTAVKQRRHIIAVGTTVCRTLETIAGRLEDYNDADSIRGETDLFIYPPYQFKLVNGLITNFHLPGGTPLILTCAFAGQEKVFQAYQEAIKQNYRFYSYGDAMFIT